MTKWLTYLLDLVKIMMILPFKQMKTGFIAIVILSPERTSRMGE